VATSEKKVLTRMENEKHYEGFVNFEDGGSEGTISASLSLALCFHDEVTIFFFYEQYSSFFILLSLNDLFTDSFCFLGLLTPFDFKVVFIKILLNSVYKYL
jgi:hypothetical protein